MKIRPYDVHGDPVMHALRAEAEADPDVIGIVVTGSRAIGAVTDESDYDVIFVVTDAALERYAQEDRAPPRGHTVDPPIHTGDIWNESPRTLRYKSALWMMRRWPSRSWSMIGPARRPRPSMHCGACLRSRHARWPPARMTPT